MRSITKKAQMEAALDKLKKEIAKHNQAYYQEDSPIITDEAYDLLFRRLQRFEANFPQYVTNDSPTQQVGAKASAHFKKVSGKGFGLLTSSVETRISK